ncbi:hypothetical protein GCM10023231_13560 [Olivibacter ginsenosidimutans]|uniref:Uncharacterized protein n=1 Tax=Olivibacter ginsenosidimutans TaxID=1176537 RepID=A0ABP9AWR1_9SPHI
MLVQDYQFGNISNDALYRITAHQTFNTLSGLYFHNGAEYYLLIILITTILIYDYDWIAMILSGLIITAFMLVSLFPQSTKWEGAVTSGQV